MIRLLLIILHIAKEQEPNTSMSKELISHMTVPASYDKAKLCITSFNAILNLH
jgi:hypothetical protein